jgi:hypothetical protein
MVPVYQRVRGQAIQQVGKGRSQSAPARQNADGWRFIAPRVRQDMSRDDHRTAVAPTPSTGTSTMTDTPPDRLSNDPNSPHHDAALLERGIGIRFKGVEKTNVEEYCVSEGWIRVSAGKAKDRFGNPLTIKLNGAVEAYFKEKSED